MQSPFRLSRLLTLLGWSDPVQGLGYLGPETLMPLASIIAAVAGFFLMFWRVIAKFTKKAYRKLRGLPDEQLPPEVDVDEPEDDKK